MANNLAILEQPTKALSLPDFLARLAIGTVDWPGQPTRRYLAGGMNLTSSQRAEVERAVEQIADALSPCGANGDKARAVLLSKMIMGSGGAALTERVAEAKAEMYRDAVDDLPPWAISDAIRKWNRGECGEQNYSFAPSPAVLRQIVLRILLPYRAASEKCQLVLSAVTLDRAMDATPVKPANSLTPMLRRV